MELKFYKTKGKKVKNMEKEIINDTNSVASYTSSVVESERNLDEIENESVISDSPLVTPVSISSIENVQIGLHESIIRMYLLCFTYGRGRKPKEFDLVYKSILYGYEHNMEQKYYDIIHNPKGKGRLKAKLGSIISDYTNCAFGFKLSKELQTQLLSRMEQYVKICAMPGMGKSCAQDLLHEIKNFIVNCSDCSERMKKKIVSYEELNAYMLECSNKYGLLAPNLINVNIPQIKEEVKSVASDDVLSVLSHDLESQPSSSQTP